MVLGLLGVSAVVVGVMVRYRQPTLRAFLDTLIPRDEYGPSATDVGLADIVRKAAEQNHWRFIELELSLLWMNFKAGGTFASASTERRNEIVSQMEAADSSSVLWKAYNFARNTCMLHYYADARRAVKMGFVGPPQPEGHAEPWGAWDKTSNG